MQIFKLVFLFSFLFLLSISIFSQNIATPDNSKHNTSQIDKKARTERLKADILQEIQTFNHEDQAYFYAKLGDIFWEYDKKEGIYWLTKGIELGVNPATDYKNDKEKLSSLVSLFYRVSEKDVVSADKIISKIKEIKIDESNPDILRYANETYISFAEHILSRKNDEKLAFEFAMLSLKGTNPAINWDTSDFFWKLKYKNENLANAYFAKLFEVVKSNGDIDLTSKFVMEFNRHRFNKNARLNISDSQKKDLLELVLSFVRQESEKLMLGQIDDCAVTRSWGVGFLEDYKRHLPGKLPLVEQAIAVCQNAEIEHWKKPDFLKKPLKTSLDYLVLAKEIPDKKLQANYLKVASSLARSEKFYRISIKILDSIEPEFRDDYWAWMKFDSKSEFVEELFRKNDFTEITKILESSPPEYRHFIIVNLFNFKYNPRLEPSQREFVLDLMSQARAGFNKMDKFIVNGINPFLNPTKFSDLTRLYVKFGLYDEAIASHEESIKLFNRLVITLPSKYKEIDAIPRSSSFLSFTNQFPRNDLDFFNKYFDRIYENVGTIENSRTRLFERLELLGKNLEKVQDIKTIPGIPSSIN